MITLPARGERKTCIMLSCRHSGEVMTVITVSSAISERMFGRNQSYAGVSLGPTWPRDGSRTRHPHWLSHGFSTWTRHSSLHKVGGFLFFFSLPPFPPFPPCLNMGKYLSVLILLLQILAYWEYSHILLPVSLSPSLPLSLSLQAERLLRCAWVPDGSSFILFYPLCDLFCGSCVILLSHLKSFRLILVFIYLYLFLSPCSLMLWIVCNFIAI